MLKVFSEKYSNCSALMPTSFQRLLERDVHHVAETFPDLLADVFADADDEAGRSHLDDLAVVGHTVEGGVDRKAAFAVQGFDVEGNLHVGGVHVLVL